MRVSNLLIMGALSALVFTGCTNNDDNSEWLDSNSVTFNSRIDGLQTKASKDVWSNGDEVGIFMTTQTAEFANKKYVASDGGTLTAAPGQTLRYPEEGTASFIAYYPYSASLNGKTLAVSVDNQADPAKVDLLYSNNAKAIAAGEAVDLAFKHKLSQIVIAVSSDETLPDISGLKISLSGMNTQADFNLADGTLAAKESKANIDMNVSADGTTAEAIILPTTTLDGVKMTFVLDGKTFEWPVSVNGGAGFEAGYKYTYTATLSTENGKPAVTMGGASIESWTDQPGGDINVDFGEGGGEKPEGEKVLLDEKFDTNEGAFAIKNLVIPVGGNRVWAWAEYTNKVTQESEQFMKASAFINGENKPSEGWLVSPVLNLSAAKKATLTFSHAHRYGVDKAKEMTLWIADEGTEVTTDATGWTQIEIPTYGTGTDYNYVTATVDLSAYAGKNKQIAFRYISTADGAPTWQIDEVKVVADGEGGGTVEPEPEPEPGEGTVLFSEGFGTPQEDEHWPSVDIYKGWENANLVFTDPLMSGSYSNASVRSTSTLDGHVWFAAGKNSALKIEGFATDYTGLKLEYEIAANKAGNQNIIKVLTDKGDVDVPDMPIVEQNKYQSVTLAIPDGASYIQFTSEKSTNTSGYRIDNVSLTGIAK